MAEDTQARAPAQQREETQIGSAKPVGQIPSSATPTFVGQSTTQRLERRREETRAAAQAAASIPTMFQYDPATAPLIVGAFELSPTQWKAIYHRIEADTIRELMARMVERQKIQIVCTANEQRRLVTSVVMVAVSRNIRPGDEVDVGSQLIQQMMVPFHDQAEEVFPQYGIQAAVVRDHTWCNDNAQRTDTYEVLKLMGTNPRETGR